MDRSGAQVAQTAGAQPGQEIEVFSRPLLRRLLLVAAFAVLVYGALLLYADAGAIAHHTREVPIMVLALGTLLASSNFVVRFFRWQFYLRRLGIKLKLGESLLVFLSGFSMSLTPGKVGEVIKALLLKEAYSIPVARTAPIVLAERVTDLAALMLLCGIGLLAVPHAALVAAAAFGVVVALFLVCAFRPLGTFAIAFVTRWHRMAPLRTKLEASYDSLMVLTHPPAFCVGLGNAVVAWGFQCVSLNVFAWGFPGVRLSLEHGFIAYAGPLVAGAFAFIPGGLGITEASMTGILSALGGSTMSPSVAASITILSRLSSFWLAIAIGFVALAIWRSRRRAGSKA